MKKLSIVPAFLLLCFYSYCFDYKGEGVYPSHWWIGMKNPKLQIMLHGDNISRNTFSISYPGVKLVKVNKVENPNYVFLDLILAANVKAGKMNIHMRGSSGERNLVYELKQRRNGKGTLYAQGVNSSDFIYLLMPDRFSNGDNSNDKVPGMRDQSLNRDSIFLRHGGDIQGVINHLDYLQDLGVTTLWMTPVLENDMPTRTEHGYAITNHYKVDPRQGGNEAYKKLSDELHKRGMKLIQDAVYNHTGLQHFFVQDLPMKDWLNQWPKYTNTTYKDQPLMDKYASNSDKKLMEDGWFTQQMPDLNQRNPYVANFLIQHALWSVEEFGVDGWRIDTYIYNDLEFMNRCNQALVSEYPKISLFGETWVHGMLNQAFFTQNNLSNLHFKSNLPGVTDFQTNLYGINPALTQNFGWTEGVNKLFQTLANDFVYKDPMKNVVFLDNHDMTRFLSQVGEGADKLKIGIAWLLTTRGIPQMYYGTEVLMRGVANPDGYVRLDFPGGWKEDATNKFTRQGRTEKENEVFEWTKGLANFRKKSSAIKAGKLMQYVPEDWVYTYFRYDENETIMVVMNTSNEEKTVDVNRFSERTNGFRKAINAINDSPLQLNEKWKVPGKTIWVLKLEK